jgi:hypothetical protein
LPWWYPVIRAAKWLGVNPLEIADMPIEWLSRILVTAEAEAHAEKVQYSKKV